jgi:hypothetical protein
MCWDSELRTPAQGRLTFCAAACTTSEQCGPGIACKVLSQHTNSTEPTGDDSLQGWCVPRGPSTSRNACKADGDCRAGLCETQTGQCYDPEAGLGDVCRGDDECPQGAICEEEDRVCVIPGCDPEDAEACPEGAVCAKGRGPVFNCIPG